MEKIIQNVNAIKAHALHHRQFRDFLDSVNSHYGDLQLHTEVRWLSKGQVLKRFWELLPETKQFLTRIGEDSSHLSSQQFLSDFAFLTDFTQHLNKLNSGLQGEKHIVSDMVFSIKAFSTKLRLFKEQMQNNNFSHFPTLFQFSTEKTYTAMDAEKIETEDFVDFLNLIIKQFDSRFQDFNRPEVETALSFLKDPINFSLEKIDLLLKCFPDIPKDLLEEELIELQTEVNPVVKRHFESGEVKEMWERLDYSTPRAIAAKVLSIFGSTYMCETSFSSMKLIFSRLRSRLSDNNLENLMICANTKFEPEFYDLVKLKECRISN